MNLVFSDLKSLGFPVNLEGLHQFGNVVLYDCLADYELSAHLKDVDVLITNQNQINENTLKDVSGLKLICQTGTGYDNIDIDFCKRNNIAVTNVAGYSSESVAQHTFAMLFHLISQIGYFDEFARNQWADSPVNNSHKDHQFFELAGKTWGIIGLGQIGTAVARHAEGFGCNVKYYSSSSEARSERYEALSLKEILEQSDILSIHSPLNSKTLDLISYEELKCMKPTAYILNLGRGGILNEEALAHALECQMIRGAGLDVFCIEPLENGSPLKKNSIANRICLTPHIGYASIEARERLMEQIIGNIFCFFNHQNRNRVV